ncbi:hypothetical protein [Saccharopolyspora shandongensis]|uniref:hypothetical protein n=1 Tax=Saccharopolyspora shandongensis TaxID=418495 RepID=UPI0033FA9115
MVVGSAGRRFSPRPGVRYRVLTGGDVLEALSWCRHNQPNPGCFVLYAGTWTNTGHLERLWLTGQAPQSTIGDPRSGAVSYLAAE